MTEPHKVLVVQTAFLGDVILTLPMVQVLKRYAPTAMIDVLVTPRAAGLLVGHPDINRVIEYDKRGNDAGIPGFIRKSRQIRSEMYDTALVPHRSLRSAALAASARIPRRIGMATSSGKWLFTETVPYDSNTHEIERNLSLLRALCPIPTHRELPGLYPSDQDHATVQEVLRHRGISGTSGMIGLAPGTVWNTKRWPQSKFEAVARRLVESGYTVVLFGGPEDAELCSAVQNAFKGVYSFAGELTLLQSAVLLSLCRALVSNDSAPLHMAVAMRTPVVAIFGATVPEFGFAPYGPNDRVVESKGLPCRPCSIHGGATCPISTFECMESISPDRVLADLDEILKETKA